MSAEARLVARWLLIERLDILPAEAERTRRALSTCQAGFAKIQRLRSRHFSLSPRFRARRVPLVLMVKDERRTGFPMTSAASLFSSARLVIRAIALELELIAGRLPALPALDLVVVMQLSFSCAISSSQFGSVTLL